MQSNSLVLSKIWLKLLDAKNEQSYFKIIISGYLRFIKSLLAISILFH